MRAFHSSQTVKQQMQFLDACCAVDRRHVAIMKGHSAGAARVDCLERAVTERTGPAYAIKSSFLMTSLYDHPRFRALLRDMKLG